MARSIRGYVSALQRLLDDRTATAAVCMGRLLLLIPRRQKETDDRKSPLDEWRGRDDRREDVCARHAQLLGCAGGDGGNATAGPKRHRDTSRNLRVGTGSGRAVSGMP